MAVMVRNAGSSGGGIKITNSIQAEYFSASGEIPENAFVVIANNKISLATTTISGITKTKATETKAGKVLVYGG